MTHFHVGDSIRMKEDCSGCEEGKVYKLIKYKDTLCVKGPLFPSEMCCCEYKWKKVNKLVSKKAEWSVREVGGGYFLCHNERSMACFYNHRTLARKVAKWLNEEER